MHFGNTRLEDILDIRGFNLNAILEIEPEGKSIQPPSLRGLPARRNPLLEPAPIVARSASYVHFAPLRTPGGGDRSELVVNY